MGKAERALLGAKTTFRHSSTIAARYYDPSRQRFISEDPIGFSAGPKLAISLGEIVEAAGVEP